MSRGVDARRCLASCRAGVLSTLSQRHAGHPFGSLVPYALDHRGRPVILVSHLAEHTRNMEADPRVSLLAHDAASDPQVGARVTLLGNAAPLEASDPAAARYRRLFPDWSGSLRSAIFHFSPSSRSRSVSSRVSARS